MRRLLGLPRAKAPLATEVLQPQPTDGDVAIENLRLLRRAGRLGAGNGGQTARGHTTAARYHLSAWHGRDAATTGRRAVAIERTPTHGLARGTWRVRAF